MVFFLQHANVNIFFNVFCSKMFYRISKNNNHILLFPPFLLNIFVIFLEKSLINIFGFSFAILRVVNHLPPSLMAIRVSPPFFRWFDTGTGSPSFYVNVVLIGVSTESKKIQFQFVFGFKEGTLKNKKEFCLNHNHEMGSRVQDRPPSLLTDVSSLCTIQGDEFSCLRPPHPPHLSPDPFSLTVPFVARMVTPLKKRYTSFLQVWAI